MKVNNSWNALGLVFLLFVVVAVGCDQPKKSKVRRDENAFENAVLVDSRPVAGRVYTLKNSNMIGGVRCTSNANVYSIPSDPDYSVSVVVTTSYDYSDGEYLREGMYRYEGNGECEIEDPVEIGENVRMVKRKVKCRSFVEVKPSISTPKSEKMP